MQGSGGGWRVSEESGEPGEHHRPGVLTDDTVFACVWQNGSSEDSAALASSLPRSVVALMGPEEGRPSRLWMAKWTLSHTHSSQAGGHPLHWVTLGSVAPALVCFPTGNSVPLGGAFESPSESEMLCLQLQFPKERSMGRGQQKAWPVPKGMRRVTHGVCVGFELNFLSAEAEAGGSIGMECTTFGARWLGFTSQLYHIFAV